MGRYKTIIFYTLILLSAIISVVFAYNNHAFYNRPIANITDAKLVHTEKVKDEYDNEDTIYEQQLTAIIKNGQQKDKSIQLINEYSTSGAYDEPYQEGNEVFISIDKSTLSDQDLKGSITGVKRDKYLVMIAWIF